ncbi:MAG: 50S ribosomal protein L18 [Endomicrobium sp.]|jgi:large subunit ribosomal protein L18|nr:50S ribosomal protein L18 [Endomicrobium sp.]
MKNSNKRFKCRVKRVRNKICGTSDRPRLCVYRGCNHVYAQIIDDTKGITIVSSSTLSRYFKNKSNNLNNGTNIIEYVGNFIAKEALKKGIKKVVFDRRGYKYIGKIKILADAVRKNGLKF